MYCTYFALHVLYVMDLWVNSWALLAWGRSWTCSHLMAGTGVIWRPEWDDAQYGWQLMAGSQLGPQLELSLETLTKTCTCGLSFSLNSSWDLRGSILRANVLRCRWSLHSFLWTICLTISLLLHYVDQASHWGQPRFRRRVSKLPLDRKCHSHFIQEHVGRELLLWVSLEYIICHRGQL